jgi:hypothetical protein
VNDGIVYLMAVHVLAGIGYAGTEWERIKKMG